MMPSRLLSVPSLGVELEMVTAALPGFESHPVGVYFEALHELRRQRGFEPVLKTIAARAVGVALPDGRLSTIDNGFNNLESCIGPLHGVGALRELDGLIRSEVSEVMSALMAEPATILNFSQHPALTIDEATYLSLRAPKPIYDYWVNGRGWRHWVGIDAKAQNGANVDVTPREATRALNVMLAFAPVFIAIYANSPFEDSVPTGQKETRLSIWPRMFAEPAFDGDRSRHITPPLPFADLADYFAWMLGEGTAIQIVPLADNLDYKGLPHVARIEGDPSAYDFLRSEGMGARHLGTGARILIRPSALHFEFLQFSHFLDARIRWRFDTYPSMAELREALTSGMEPLFERHASGCYIEMRAAGANFPDAEFLEEAPDDAVGSMVISTTALVAGLISNLAEAEALMMRIGWTVLRAARDGAIAEGLDARVGTQALFEIAGEVLAIARRGLPAQHHTMLAYPEHVVRTRRSGADRALEAFAALHGSDRERIAAIAARRRALHPERWPTLTSVATGPEASETVQGVTVQGATVQGVLGAASIVS